MRWIAVVAAVVASAPSIARAGEPIGFAMDLSVGGGLHTGELSDHAKRLAPHLSFAVGLSQGPWAALIGVEMPAVFELTEATSDAQPVPPTVSYLGVGVGPSLRRELTHGNGLRAHVRIGYSWRWLHGDSEVRRTCNVHGGCAGGFWTETPTYAAHGPMIAIGLSGRIPSSPRGSHWLAIGVELAAGHLIVDRLGQDPDLSGTFVGLGLNVAIGRD